MSRLALRTDHTLQRPTLAAQRRVVDSVLLGVGEASDGLAVNEELFHARGEDRSDGRACG